MPYQDKTKKEWVGQVRVHGVKRKKTGFPTKSAAMEWERLAKKEMKTPPPIASNSSNAALDYLEYCKRRYKPNTYRQKTFILTQLLTHLDADPPIEEITQIMVESYLDARFTNDGGKSANRDLRELSTFFNWLIQRDRLPTNPCKAIEKYKEPQFIRYVPPADDIRAIIAVASPDESDMIRVAYHSLARAGELRRMKYTHCDLGARTITIYTRKRKGGSLEGDTISMNDSLHEIVARRHRNSKNEWIFPNQNGDQLSRNTIAKVMPRLCKAAGVEPFGFHSIRHHVASLLATRLPLIEIQKLLRHKRATTTDVYLRSLVKVDTKGVHVLDDLESEMPDNVVPFNKVVNSG